MWPPQHPTSSSVPDIGDGSSVFIYKVKCLPRSSTFRVISPCTLGEDAVICDLKLPTGGWDVKLVRDSFLPDDANLILSLPFSNSVTADSLLWHFEKLGGNTVCSGYRVGCYMMLNPSSSGLSKLESWWKFLWLLKIPSKFLDFLESCKNQQKLEEVEVLCIIIWHVWCRRNGLVHKSGFLPDSDVVPWAYSFLSEFQITSSKNPEAATLSLGKVGIGVIIRDADWKVIASSAQVELAGFSPEVAEVVVLLRVLQLLEHFLNYSVKFVLRKANMVAHGLSKLGLSVVSDLFWLEDFPHYVAFAILGNCPNQM
ncbi:hypothetical protein Dsin_009193 [Dipteronia sinensis]|uniref:RNase H type-1 domain-containing protein n=1 Tax=Dipteronia sinensis TaxID=43782 RepID=A0AAE0AQK3_9ROSI|nr:hypothetical protein Dsin_009193 [Dipteronia sinensis]